jgi:hypothetical protein
MKGTIQITKEELVSLYEKEKLTTFQIAKKIGCCQATIWKKLNKYNIKPRLPGAERIKISKEQIKELYINKKLSTWKIEKETNIPRGTIHRKLKEFGLVARDRSDSHIIHKRKDFSGDLMEKAYLIGFRIGDLGVRRIWPNSKTICIASGSTIKEQIDLIESLFRRYGKVRIKTTKNNKTNIWVGLNNSFDFLLSKEVPVWIKINDKYFISFLAGFTDAEGSFFIASNMASYSIGNYDKKILELISKKLNNLLIICRGPYEGKTKKYVNPQGYGHNQNYFNIRVNRKDSLLKLFSILKPYIRHKNKIEALKKAENNINMRNEQYGQR